MAHLSSEENSDLWQHLKECGVANWHAYRDACERLGLDYRPNTPVMRADHIKLLHALKAEKEKLHAK